MTNAIPNQPTKAQVVAFEVLLGEREYQTETHPDSPPPSIVDFANLLIEYTDKLAVDATVDPTGASPVGGPLKRLREIAAIALHAMEIYGIQPRENHVPASAGITGVLKVVAGPDRTAPTPPLGPIGATGATGATGIPLRLEGRVMAPPLTQQAAPPHPTSTAAPASPHHEAVQLPHHPPGEEHGKK